MLAKQDFNLSSALMELYVHAFHMDVNLKSFILCKAGSYRMLNRRCWHLNDSVG